MRQLGIATEHKAFGIPIEDDLAAIKRAGFDCVFSTYSQSFDVDAAVKAALALGLYYETIHAPFGRCGLEENLNSIWVEGEHGEAYIRLLMDCVDACSRNGIEKCVLHNAVATVPPPVSDIGKKRFAALLDYAESKNVHMAIENLESNEHLAALMSIAGDFHGFCWDCGHNLCYTPFTDMPALYGDRLICTHIDDNKGITRPGYIHYTDDLHLMPFDGCLDWDWYAGKIKATGYKGPLTFELKTVAGLTPDQFYARAYERAVKLAEMCE